MIERQCQGWGASYMVLGPFGLRVSSQTDPVTNRVVSYTIDAWEDWNGMTIWMDGRPRPSELRAPHAGRLHDRPLGRRRAGRADDAREGGLHPQDRRAADRPGHHRLALLPPRRRHDRPDGGAPIRSISWSRKSSRRASGCRERRSTTATQCVTGYEGREPGDSVPHFAPDQNPFADEFVKFYHLPREAVLGYPRDAVSGVPEEDQGHLRPAAAVHRILWCRRQLRSTPVSGAGAVSALRKSASVPTNGERSSRG